VPSLVSIHQYVVEPVCQTPAAAMMAEPALSSISFILSLLSAMPFWAILNVPCACTLDAAGVRVVVV
jgi:hypothetical protein